VNKLKKKTNPDNVFVDSKELVEFLHGAIRAKGRTTQHTQFSVREAIFLSELILHKQNDLVLFVIADYMADNYHSRVSVFANGASFRRLQFFKQFLLHKGNATKAAIGAGYSPKSAKQQGHRLLRWIQNNQHKSVSGFPL